MRFSAGPLLLLVALQLRELPPTPLEAFAARPAARVVSSKTIGQLDATRARAVVTAVAIEDASATPRIMRGLRIDLTHLVANPDCNQIYWDWSIVCARPNAAVFIEEDRLPRALETMRQRGTAEVHAGAGGGITTFWRGSVKPSGLIVVGYTLDDRQPGELAALFEEGLAALTAMPR